MICALEFSRKSRGEIATILKEVGRISEEVGVEILRLSDVL